MQNFEYRAFDKKIVIDEREQAIVAGELAKGKTIIILRGGKVILNMSLGILSPTSELTEAQAEQKLKVQNETNIKMLAGSGEVKSIGDGKCPLNGLPDIKNPEDKVCVGCAPHIHFIPVGDKCVACSKTYIRSASVVRK